VISAKPALVPLLATLLAGVCALFLVMLNTAQGAQGADGERCANFAFQAAARERLVTGTGHPVAVLGDSYSVGLGLRDPERSWPAQIPGRVHVFGFSGSGFSAHASGCRRVSYADRVRRAARNADLVVVEGGLNDVDRPDAEIRAGVREVLRVLRHNTVVVVGPVRAPSRAAGVQRVDALLADECSRAGVRYVSMVDLSLPYLADGLHLTLAGHRTFGEAVARALSR
jgi:acyl-CoA thioesterase-1